MMKNVWLTVLLVCIDQAVKIAVRQSPADFSYDFLPGFMRITHCTNSGAAFSLLSGQTAFLIVGSALLMAGILLFVNRSMKLTRTAKKGCAILIGGGVSNLIDRICFGGVTDYFELQWFTFPIFNIADIAVTLSVALLLILTLTGKLEDATGE